MLIHACKGEICFNFGNFEGNIVAQSGGEQERSLHSYTSKKKLNLIFELTCVSQPSWYIGRRQDFSFIITWCFIHFHHGRGI